MNKDSHIELSESSGGSETKSSPFQFQKRGLYFQDMAFESQNHESVTGLLETAVVCFRQAKAEDLMQTLMGLQVLVEKEL